MKFRHPARLPAAWVLAMLGALLLAGLVALTLLAAPVKGYLDAAAAGLHDPSAYAAAALARAGGM